MAPLFGSTCWDFYGKFPYLGNVNLDKVLILAPHSELYGQKWGRKYHCTQVKDIHGGHHGVKGQIAPFSMCGDPPPSICTLGWSPLYGSVSFWSNEPQHLHHCLTLTFFILVLSFTCLSSNALSIVYRQSDSPGDCWSSSHWSSAYLYIYK